MDCLGCGAKFEPNKYQIRRVKEGKATFCNRSCASRSLYPKRKDKMIAGWNASPLWREKITERMLNRNPMFDSITREKQRTSMRAAGIKPARIWRRGEGPTTHEKLLAVALGWPNEVRVLTGRPPPYPTHYKIDVANEKLKVGVEVDGPSHLRRDVKSRDRRKEAFLSGLGWKIVRFTNKQIDKDLKSCVEAVLNLVKGRG